MSISKEKAIQIAGAAILLSLQCQFSNANVIGFGSCPTLTQGTLAVNPFTGATTAGSLTWYVHRRFPSYHVGLNCLKLAATTASTAANYLNSVVITGKKPITGTTVTITGAINQRVTTDFTVFDSTFTGATGVTVSHLPTSMVVAASDGAGKTYMVLYSCQNFGLFNKQYSWVLTSTVSESDSNIDLAVAAAKLAGVPTSKYVTVPQSSC